MSNFTKQNFLADHLRKSSNSAGVDNGIGTILYGHHKILRAHLGMSMKNDLLVSHLITLTGGNS